MAVSDEASGTSARRRRQDEPTEHPSLALLVVVTGVLITAIDTTIVVLALPEIQRSLHIGLASVIWVVIGYLLVITLVSTQVGRLGDMFGRVRMYEAGFVVFIVGSLACALAWSELSLIVFRLAQGVGGALITANSGAVIADTFPKERRGRAYGFNSIGFNTGAVLGVILGGIIVTYVSWRWIFWINVPIGIAAVVVANRVLFDRGERQQRRIDWWGMVTLGLGLFGPLWAMVKLTSEPLDATTIAFFSGGLVMLLVFWRIERSTREPMLDLELFKVPTMTPSLLAAMFQSLANFAVLFLLLMYLQGVRHLSPIHASLLLVPGYITGGVVGPFAGRFADRHGAVLPATVGLGIQVLALLAYAQFGLTTPYWAVVVAYMVGAIGAGCFFPSNNSAVMKAAPGDEFGITSGLLRTFANVGMVFSFALAILVASESITKAKAFAIFVGTSSLSPSTAAAFTDGIHSAFYSSTVLMLIAAVLSAWRVRATRTLPARAGPRDHA
ncbi:MAG: MFS transporter [Acidimicrobiales bacterium]|jgi:EmrB/QacA subfamily drug resistance transporter